MPVDDQSSPRASFSQLHRQPLPLLLPNAWDVPSALMFQEAGYLAIGTTSFGVASSAGRPDGGRATREPNLNLAGALASLASYVSMDIEDGYSDDADEVSAYVETLVRHGIAGVNIEDSTAERLIPGRDHAAKVAAIKRRTPDVFVNARVDTYWLDQDAHPDATLSRAKTYVDAGADGIFLPGLSDSEVLRRLTSAVSVPVNILPIPGLSLAELATLGVRRVSTGSLPYRAALAAAAKVATAVREGLTPPDAYPYAEFQDRLVDHDQHRAPGASG